MNTAHPFATLLITILVGSFSVFASDVNVDPQREDTFLQHEQPKGVQWNDRTRQQAQIQNLPRVEIRRRPQDYTNAQQTFDEQHPQHVQGDQWDYRSRQEEQIQNLPNVDVRRRLQDMPNDQQIQEDRNLQQERSLERI